MNDRTIFNDKFKITKEKYLYTFTYKVEFFHSVHDAVQDVFYNTIPIYVIDQDWQQVDKETGVYKLTFNPKKISLDYVKEDIKLFKALMVGV